MISYFKNKIKTKENLINKQYSNLPKNSNFAKN